MSDDNKRLEETIKEYAEMAKSNKNIDVASLMVSALQREDQNKLKASTRRWAYILSLGFPPLGYVLALWFFFKSESDAKSTALICAILTTLAIIFTIVLLRMILSGSSTDLEQLQQVNPQEIYDLLQ